VFGFLFGIADNGYQETFPGTDRHDEQGTKETKGPEEKKEARSQRAAKVSNKTTNLPKLFRSPLGENLISSQIIRC
jgi:hypothetical protein